MSSVMSMLASVMSAAAVASEPVALGAAAGAWVSGNISVSSYISCFVFLSWRSEP